MKSSILYQAYGSIDIINECKFSLLRLIDVYSTHERPQIIIYTDRKECFQFFEMDLDISFVDIDQQKCKAWKGQIDFVHRVKIEVMKDALQHIEGNLVYCDTDTYFKTTLETIFNSISPTNVYFHIQEGIIKNDFRKWTKFLSLNNSKLLKKYNSLHTEMWNAGVIGLHKDHAPLLDEVLELTDNIYPLFPKHTVEQFSFCYTFQKHGVSISAADPFIFHYWDLKEFRVLLKDFFQKHQLSGVNEMVTASRNVLPENILPSKMRFKKSGFISKLSKQVIDKTWNIQQHFLSADSSIV